MLSGTHAPVDLRLKVVRKMLEADDAAVRGVGVNSLHAMLKTGFFSTSYSFEFGARSRDYGYHPRSHQDVVDWFTRVLTFAEPFAVPDSPIAAGVRKVIAEEFRGLWDQAPDQLEQV